MSKPACLWSSFSQNSTPPSTAPDPPATAPTLSATISLTATAPHTTAESRAATESHAATSSDSPCFYACTPLGTPLGTPPALGAFRVDTGEAPPAGLRGESAGPPASRHVPAHVDLSRCLGLSYAQALHT